MFKSTISILLAALFFLTSCGNSTKVKGLWEVQSNLESFKVYYDTDGTFKRIAEVKLLGFSLVKIASGGTWTLEGDRLIETVDNSQEPFIIPVGTISSWEIVDSGREFMIIRKDGKELTCKRLDDSAVKSFEESYYNSMENSSAKVLGRKLAEAREKDAEAQLLRITPESAVKVFFTALGQGDYDNAKLMATEKTKSVLSQVESINQGKEKPFDVTEVNCVHESRNHAICDLCCDANGNPKQGIDVVKEEGGWAVKMEDKEQFSKEESTGLDPNSINEDITETLESL